MSCVWRSWGLFCACVYAWCVFVCVCVVVVVCVLLCRGRLMCLGWCCAGCNPASQWYSGHTHDALHLLICACTRQTWSYDLWDAHMRGSVALRCECAHKLPISRSFPSSGFYIFLCIDICVSVTYALRASRDCPNKHSNKWIIRVHVLVALSLKLILSLAQTA